MKRFFLLLLALNASLLTYAQSTDYASFVDPFIGTGGAGHTYPGATVPYGMLQLSPDTRIDGSWEGCSGYHYSDSVLYGFSHTHLSGTGCSDYGDVLLLPFRGATLPAEKKSTRFRHSDEVAKPGYYAVKLRDEKVDVELTAALRSGFHRYRFDADDTKNILVDLYHRDRLLDGKIDVVSSTRIEGYRRSEAWAKDQWIYFSIEFDQPFQWIPMPEADGQKVRRAVLRFDSKNNVVCARIGISSVSTRNAAMNLATDFHDWDFDAARKRAHDAWNKELRRIEITGASQEQRTVFYTALYHCMVVPNTYSDANGEYRGRDGKTHRAVGYTQYSVFSLWDTFRAWHPLMTLIDRARTLDYIKTFLAQYQQGGMLPVWELSANETECMIGYHAIPVIVDAWMNGIREFDGRLALEAMRHSAESRERFGLGAYIDGGRLTLDDEHESVSKTLEYAYDDWCIAQFAQAIGQPEIHKQYMLRSQSWKNLFDPVTGFIRPVKNGGWMQPFDPYEVNNNFTEANAWQYTFFVPQDIPGLMNRLGGKEGFAAKLDALFSADTKTTGREQADISGLIGQYAHGNEPSHNMAYLYDYAGQPWKTQQRVRQILDGFYKPLPDGLIGNEDCGQMSAWYVMSAMGFYAVTPGSGYYAIGTPLFPQVTVHLENGKELNILVDESGPGLPYIQQADFNGQSIGTSFITTTAIQQGGVLSFSMGDRPNTGWGIGPFLHPSVEQGQEIVLTPMLISEGYTFVDTMRITIASEVDSVFYTIDGRWPDSRSTRYTGPIAITESGTLQAIAYKNGRPSKLARGEFFKVPHPDWTVTLSSTYSSQYSAGGPSGLINGIRGSVNWRKGDWQGYQGQDFEAVVDMGKSRSITNVSTGFLQDVRPWIFMPSEVIYSVSTDGTVFTEVYRMKNTLPDSVTEAQVIDFKASLPKTEARYVKVKAINYGNLPAWHPGAGYPAYIFVDEIEIK